MKKGKKIGGQNIILELSAQGLYINLLKSPFKSI